MTLLSALLTWESLQCVSTWEGNVLGALELVGEMAVPNFRRIESYIPGAHSVQRASSCQPVPVPTPLFLRNGFSA